MEAIFDMNIRHIVCKIFADLIPPDFAQCLAVCKKWNIVLTEEVKINAAFAAKRKWIEEEWIWMRRGFRVTHLPKYQFQYYYTPIQVNHNLIYATGQNVAMFWDVESLLADTCYQPKTLTVSSLSLCLAATKEWKVISAQVNPVSVQNFGPKLLFYDDNGLAFSNYATTSICESPKRITQETFSVLALMFDRDNLYIIEKPKLKEHQVELLQVVKKNDGSIVFESVCMLPLTGQEFPNSQIINLDTRNTRAICGHKFPYFSYHGYYEASGNEPFVLIYDTEGKSTILSQEVARAREGKTLLAISDGKMDETFFTFITCYGAFGGHSTLQLEVLHIYRAETGAYLGEYEGGYHDDVAYNYHLSYTLGGRRIAYLTYEPNNNARCHILTLTQNGDLVESYQVLESRENLFRMELIGRTGTGAIQ